MNHNKTIEIVTKYMAAWNEADAARRNALLEQCWTDGGIYVDPGSSWPAETHWRSISQRCRPAAPARGSNS
jgi:hypothetical protein